VSLVLLIRVGGVLCSGLLIRVGGVSCSGQCVTGRGLSHKGDGGGTCVFLRQVGQKILVGIFEILKYSDPHQNPNISP
jgi:hypothetical protein